MRPLTLIALCTATLFALPAAADGYATPRYTSPAPAPLNPHQKQIRIVEIHKEHAGHGYSGCHSSCGSYQYGRTYVTEPVVTRRYTRTYTRMAPPACPHASGSAGHHPHHGHGYHSSHSYGGTTSYTYAHPTQHGYHAYSSGGSTAYHSSHHNAPRYGYSYERPVVHTDRDKAWAHYDRSWKSKTTSGR